MNGAICIFAKVPLAGRVKTRLARSLGDAAAVALAEAFLEDTVALARAVPDATVVIAFDGDAPARWCMPAVEAWHQGEGGLADRLERVLTRALREHAWAIALGADSPGLPPRLLEAAASALVGAEPSEAVVGPSRDGGFYLLGVKTVVPGALAGVRWSTSDALVDTERALERAHVTTSRLEPWFDVDELADLEHLRGLLARGAVHAPATARALAAVRLLP